jgi:trans-aconitate methyltransferase
MLAAFAEKVRRAPAGPVVDLGCGPGDRRQFRVACILARKASAA